MLQDCVCWQIVLERQDISFLCGLFDMDNIKNALNVATTESSARCLKLTGRSMLIVCCQLQVSCTTVDVSWCLLVYSCGNTEDAVNHLYFHNCTPTNTNSHPQSCLSVYGCGKTDDSQHAPARVLYSKRSANEESTHR